MTARCVGLMTGLLLTIAVSPVGAQSLGDVARQEAARREQMKSTGKVLTNADLPASAVIPPAGTASDGSASGLVGAANAASGQPAGEPGAALTTDEVKARAATAAEAPRKEAAAPADDEEGWKTRAARVNGALASARAQVRQLDGLSDRLSLESQAADPAIASRATREWAELKLQMAKAQEALAAATADRATLEQEARVSGVPPAWIQ